LEIQGGCQGLIFDEKITILPVDHPARIYKVGPIVFILGKNIAKCKDMPYGRRSAEIQNGCQGAFITFVFALDSTNMDGCFCKFDMLTSLGYSILG
jgi:hypothetical protein